jgi:tRNA nucleotidyltransferase (CCA-adding enzyme)
MQKIYLVGGAVRDMLLQISNYDKDYVAVGYSERDFSHLKKVGKDFPIFLQEDGSELALARREKKVSSGYNGFEVDTKDVTIEEDLSRRDLTINSMAYDEDSKSLIDPFDGQSDIRKKILKHTTNAFCEDPLRVLRLARFRAKLGIDWKIHHTTKVLVYSMREELKCLQSDRVYKEVVKVLHSGNARVFYETLFELGILDIVFPNIYLLTTLKEGSQYHREATVFEHTMMVLQKLHNQSHLLQLTALYHDIAKPYCYRKFGNSSGHDMVEFVEKLIDIQLPSKLQKNMLFIISLHIRVATLDQMSPNKIAKFFELFKKRRDLLETLITFYNADNHGRICEKEIIDLDEEKLLKTFDAIQKVSVKEWMDSMDKVPNVEAIQQFIHKSNIDIVKEYFDRVK